MKYMLAVCLIVLTLTLSQALGQSPALQKGVSVQMVPTTHAEPMPAADNQDAWVVAVTADGGLYFGADPMTPETLMEWMKTHPRNREAKLYIKADARAPFSNVEKALDAARADGFATAELLTAQVESTAPGTMVPPKGLEVLVGSALPAGTATTVVQLLNSGQQRPLLMINGDEILWSDLESTLRQHFLKGDAKVILLKANTQLPFAHVIQVVDACHAEGANVVLGTPER
jgi:biopolymer transport protein ExbD